MLFCKNLQKRGSEFANFRFSAFWVTSGHFRKLIFCRIKPIDSKYHHAKFQKNPIKIASFAKKCQISRNSQKKVIERIFEIPKNLTAVPSEFTYRLQKTKPDQNRPINNRARADLRFFCMHLDDVTSGLAKSPEIALIGNSAEFWCACIFRFSITLAVLAVYSAPRNEKKKHIDYNICV